MSPESLTESDALRMLSWYARKAEDLAHQNVAPEHRISFHNYIGLTRADLDKLSRKLEVMGLAEFITSTDNYFVLTEAGAAYCLLSRV